MEMVIASCLDLDNGTTEDEPVSMNPSDNECMLVNSVEVLIS